MIKAIFFRAPKVNADNELRRMQTDELVRILAQTEFAGTALSVSGSAHLLRGLRFEGTIEDLSYPEYDCRSIPRPDASYSMYLSDQVLEHVGTQPDVVFSEAFRLLKKDGIAIISTCLLNPIHMAPADYLRFTPYGIQELAERAGFTTIQHFTIGHTGDFIMQRLGGAGMDYTRLASVLTRILGRVFRRSAHTNPIMVGAVLRK
ncbi:class I SAM-dependent methyltransferase [Mesorhizobium muleiense]|uniref:Methyltransferase domain-containing protein n=1 Tax=Mesorhizobium muleiense TaxID=1004279 RepID=A0A1G8VMG0_9HYPH|nr:methyltransferase domain-containing protein [Mesorhizobium muleiense]MCF6098536.1 class I SAM-dependent methyltransferase [Mesorhizobium muleiense]SDJ67248.1 Methyltransferase domain-containing protein [Mesorhizobium muleiense]